MGNAVELIETERDPGLHTDDGLRLMRASSVDLISAPPPLGLLLPIEVWLMPLPVLAQKQAEESCSWPIYPTPEEEGPQTPVVESNAPLGNSPRLKGFVKCRFKKQV